MADKKCKYCAMMIPQEAMICPYCRKRVNKFTHYLKVIGIGLLIFLGSLFIYGRYIYVPSIYRDLDKIDSDIRNLEKTVKPVLELQSWRWYISDGRTYAIAEGEIQNKSDKTMSNITAVFSTYDKNDNFISSDSSLIEYHALLPNQKSPFKVMLNYNPAMEKANIDFKEFSGGVIRWKDKNN